MIYGILIGLSFALLGGFLMLTAFEGKRGLRVAGAFRNKLDAQVARVAFIATHVDWRAFFRHLLGTLFERAVHDIASGTLGFVRSVERILTRTVRSIRARRGLEAPEEIPAEAPNPVMARIEKVRAAVLAARQAARKPRKKPIQPEG